MKGAYKILLINPRIPDTFWSFTHAIKFIRKKAAYPPLGLATVAAMLPEHWEVRLVDENVKGFTEADLYWADLAFIGAMSVQRKSAEMAIARCRAANVPVVAGGPLFSTEPERYPHVDHLVLGEAERTLPQFIADLANSCARRVYEAGEFPDLSETPAPRWDLLDIKKYASMSVQFSRGCPFNCEFCNVTSLFGRRVRTKSAAQIIGELNAFADAGWKGNVFFVDDNFIGNRAYLKSTLLPALIKWRRGRRGFVFFTEASINLADDPELMDMMAEAGFDTVFIGIESPDEESLAECRKHQNKGRDLLESIRRIHRHGLEVQGGFIVGFDADTKSIFDRQVEFIQQSGIATAMVGLLQAIPGTRLFDRLKREDRLSGVITGDNVDGTTNIIPRMGMETLTEGYRALMKKLYSPRFYYKRVKVFLKEVERPHIRMPLSFGRLMAAARSGVQLGIFGKERFQYWRLMLWTLVRRPRLLPTAVTLSIYGRHFRKVCERYIINPDRRVRG